MPSQKVRSWDVFRSLSTFLEGIWSPRVSLWTKGSARPFGPLVRLSAPLYTILYYTYRVKVVQQSSSRILKKRI